MWPTQDSDTHTHTQADMHVCTWSTLAELSELYNQQWVTHIRRIDKKTRVERGTKGVGGQWLLATSHTHTHTCAHICTYLLLGLSKAWSGQTDCNFMWNIIQTLVIRINNMKLQEWREIGGGRGGEGGGEVPCMTQRKCLAEAKPRR